MRRTYSNIIKDDESTWRIRQFADLRHVGAKHFWVNRPFSPGLCIVDCDFENWVVILVCQPVLNNLLFDSSDDLIVGEHQKNHLFHYIVIWKRHRLRYASLESSVKPKIQLFSGDATPRSSTVPIETIAFFYCFNKGFWVLRIVLMMAFVCSEFFSNKTQHIIGIKLILHLGMILYFWWSDLERT